MPASYQTILEAIKRERSSLFQAKRRKQGSESEQREDLNKKFNMLQIGHGTVTKSVGTFMHLRQSPSSKKEKLKQEAKKKL